MKLRSLVAVVSVAGSALTAQAAWPTYAFVSDFDAQGPGLTENPCVGGAVTIVSHEELPGQVDTVVTGVFYGLRPSTTYDLRILSMTGEIGIPDAVTTNFLGIRFFRLVIQDAPAAFTDQPTVELFIDSDGELLNPHEPDEPRAGGSAE